MVNVFVERDNKRIRVDAKSAKEVMQSLNINPETVLIVKNNELILAEDQLNPEDEIILLSVISGG